MSFVKRSRQDPNFAIEWEVQGGNVSGSEDLGYTYGIGKVTRTLDDGDIITFVNPYLGVWQKGEDGKWRMVVEK